MSISSGLRVPMSKGKEFAGRRTGDRLGPEERIRLGVAFGEGLIAAAAVAVTHVAFGGSSRSAVSTAAIASAAWLVAFAGFGLYSRLRISSETELSRLVGASAVGLLLADELVSAATSATRLRSLGLAWIVALLLALLARQLWRQYVGALKASGRLSLRTLILGTDPSAAHVGHTLKRPGSGYDPVGYIAATESVSSPDGLPIVGTVDRLAHTIREEAADCLFIMPGAVDEDSILPVMRAARQEGVEIRIGLLSDMAPSRVSIQRVGSAAVLSLKRVRLTRPQTITKRAFDLFLASLGLLLALPLWLAIAVAIRLTSPGPILFRQERITKGGRRFTMLKFRTMMDGGDGPALAEGTPTRPFFKIRSDPRLTSVGRLIRKLSLDELPQLVNVLRGDMSLVGPRPLPAEQVAANATLLEPRHEVLAGLTGWWQVNGRSDVDAHEALHLDTYYIENWSLGLDLHILLKTFSAVLKRKGAY